MTDVDITADGRRAAGWDDLEPGAEQSWLLDYLVRVAGRTWNMEEASRWFPPDARSEAMIPSAFERGAERAELMARAADKAGNADAAIHLYFQASRQHRHAAHAIDRDDDPQMTYFYERVDECYDRIIELSPNPIERAEI